MRRKSKVEARDQSISPDDYRRLAQESVERCLAMPANHTRSRAVQIIMAKAWDKLADQAEELRRHQSSAAT
jgi:hypothetical protein